MSSKPLPLVLFVDDVPDIRGLIEAGVRTYQPAFRVAFADTSDAALEVLCSVAVSAAVLDVNLTGESGASLAAVMHDNYPLVPKAFLTAYDRSVTHEHAEEFEMEVWTKPITMPKLISCVYSLLARSPSECDKRPGSSGTALVTMPDVLRKITSSVFIFH